MSTQRQQSMSRSRSWEAESDRLGVLVAGQWRQIEFILLSQVFLDVSSQSLISHHSSRVGLHCLGLNSWDTADEILRTFCFMVRSLRLKKVVFRNAESPEVLRRTWRRE